MTKALFHRAGTAGFKDIKEHISNLVLRFCLIPWYGVNNPKGWQGSCDLSVCKTGGNKLTQTLKLPQNFELEGYVIIVPDLCMYLSI